MAILLARPPAAPTRARRWMNWRNITVGAVLLVLLLSALSNSWERQRFVTGRQQGGELHGRRRAERGGQAHDPETGAGEAEEQLQQLAATIEHPEGAAAVLKQGSGAAARTEEGGARAAAAGASSPPPPSPATPSPPPPSPPPPSPPPKKAAGWCLKEQTWVPKALDFFFEVAWRSTNESTQTTAESLAGIDTITWIDGYRPGHDEVTLRFDPAKGRVVMDVREAAKPNLQYKKECSLQTLKGAVEAHNEELAELLAGREMKFVVATEDFGLVWRGMKSKLPTFALCTDNDHSDIPVPDFTYACYPETRYVNSSWPAVRDLLTRKSAMLRWEDRRNDIFHRSHWGVGPRGKLMPLFQSYQNSSRDEAAFGARVNVGDSGFSPHLTRGDNYVWLDSQCDHRYQIHTAGFSYSAGLKYKLACGSLVFKFESTFKEFYEPALEDGVHVVKLQEDVAKFEAETVPRIREAVVASQGADMPAMAKAGQDFVVHNLTMDALYCYWYGALVRYSEIYFLEKTPAQLEAEAKRAQQAQQQAQQEAAAQPLGAAAAQQQQQQQQAKDATPEGGAASTAGGSAGGTGAAGAIKTKQQEQAAGVAGAGAAAAGSAGQGEQPGR